MKRLTNAEIAATAQQVDKYVDETGRTINVYDNPLGDEIVQRARERASRLVRQTTGMNPIYDSIGESRGKRLNPLPTLDDVERAR